MANELQHLHSATGSTLYFVVRKPNGSAQMWNGSTWEARTVANWANYDVAMTETPASGYLYLGSMPAIAAGWYWLDVYDQAEMYPAIDDTLLASYFVHWDGISLKWWGVDTVQVGGEDVEQDDPPLTPQQVRDALKLTPTVGDPQGDSVDKHLDDLLLLVGPGDGPVPVTITVDDGADPVANAEVTVYDAGVRSGYATTDANGQVTLNLAAGSYDVAIYHAGYTSGEETLTVPDDGDPTYSIDALATATPGTPPFVTGRYTAYYEGAPQSGQTIELQLHTLPSGDVGGAYDRDYTETTGVDGTCDFVGLVEGAVYLARRNAGQWRRITIPADDDEDGVVDLTSIFGP